MKKRLVGTIVVLLSDITPAQSSDKWWDNQLTSVPGGSGDASWPERRTATSRARIEVPMIDGNEGRQRYFTPGYWDIDQDEDIEWSSQALTARPQEMFQETSQELPSHEESPSKNLQLHLHQSSTSSISNSKFSSDASTKKIPDSLLPHLTKTGTTIAGCVCPSTGHVILAADTRATEGTYVADKGAQKLHPIAPNAWCAGAGTSADLEHTTNYALYSMALDRLLYTTIGNQSTERRSGASRASYLQRLYTTPEKEQEEIGLLSGQVSVEKITSLFEDRLFPAQGNLGVNLIMGVVYQGKPHLRAIHPHGSVDVDLPFAALGSGGLAAMSVLERGYPSSSKNWTLTDSMELVQQAIVAGIRNDLGSGSQVDMCVIAPDGSSTHQRCVVPPCTVPEDEHARELPTEETLSGDQQRGVNGFGNTPFAVVSERPLVVEGDGISARVQEERKEWSQRMGLQKDS